MSYCSSNYHCFGKKLSKVVVIKGKQAGSQITKEFDGYKKQYGAWGIYTVPDNSWMDKEVTSLWIWKVLQPYVTKAP